MIPGQIFRHSEKNYIVTQHDNNIKEGIAIIKPEKKRGGEEK